MQNANFLEIHSIDILDFVNETHNSSALRVEFIERGKGVFVLVWRLLLLIRLQTIPSFFEFFFY